MTITLTGVQSSQSSASTPPPPPALSPIQQGDVASGRAGVVEGQVFSIGDRSAPATASWGDQPAGSPYRQAFDAVAARIGTPDRAAVTAEIDRQLYGTAAPSVDPTLPSETAPADAAPAKSEEGVGAFFEGALKGDFSGNDSWSALAGQTVVGFIPVVGQIADARDTAAAIGQVARGEEGGWIALGAAAIGWIPGGDIAKGGLRAADNVAEAGVDVVRRTADDAAAAARITRSVDPATGRVQIRGEGGRPGDWPAELNARTLEPHADYHVNGYHYATDAKGRVTTVEGRLDLETAPRNSYQQQVSGRTDRLPDDQGGHLIASIFKGPGDRLNLVPMNGNFNMGAWRSMESRFADALAKGHSVDLRIKAVYADDSARPTRFIVISITDGGRPVRNTFQNAPGGQ